MKYWYAFHTKPHKERQVAAQLRQRRCEVFLPLADVYRPGAQAAREQPCFPGYLFARVDLEVADPGTVHWLPGLRQLVQFGGQPAVLPAHSIVELRHRLARLRSAGGLRLDGLERGAAVRIVSGPFAGYEALFDLRLEGTERVRVLLEWVAHTHRPRLIPIELSLSSIEKISRKP